MGVTKASDRPSVITSVKEHFVETRAEMRKVVWPTREEAINLSLVVMVVVVAMTILLGAMDYLFGRILNLLISWFQG